MFQKSNLGAIKELNHSDDSPMSSSRKEKKEKGAVRETTFWNTELPLTSKRVRIILSSPDADNLVDAIRKIRKSGEREATFKVSREVQEEIEKN